MVINQPEVRIGTKHGINRYRSNMLVGEQVKLLIRIISTNMLSPKHKTTFNNSIHWAQGMLRRNKVSFQWADLPDCPWWWSSLSSLWSPPIHTRKIRQSQKHRWRFQMKTGRPPRPLRMMWPSLWVQRPLHVKWPQWPAHGKMATGFLQCPHRKIKHCISTASLLSNAGIGPHYLGGKCSVCTPGVGGRTSGDLRHGTGHQLKYSIPVLTYLSLNLKDKLLKQPFPHNSNMLVKVHRTNMGDWLKVLFFCFLPCWYKPTQPVSSRLQNYVINFHIIYVLSLNWHIYNIL